MSGQTTARETVTVEDTRILFRNFSGKPDTYNQNGARNFAVVLPDPLAEELRNEGWNIKTLDGYEDEEPIQVLQLTLGYKGRPPRVVMMANVSKTRTPLDERSVGVLDAMDIVQVDVIFRPYHWEVQGNKGIKAYVKSLFVIIDEDPLELKYMDWADGPDDILEEA